MPPQPNKQKPTPETPPTAITVEAAADAQIHKSRRSLRWFVVLWIVLLSALALAWFNRYDIHDWLTLRDYKPSAEIQKLADQNTMTDYAKRMFYINRPQLVSSVDSFRKNCPDSRDTVVLGCYHPDQAGIYIYNVKDPALQGVAQVTAAHEDLHAIYGRLSNSERQRVNDMLQDYYEHGLTDENVKKEIELYKKTEPNSLPDEMHSIFGTEVANLPAPLEDYYKQYFKNRSAIVAYQKKYEKAFSARRGIVQADDERLVIMKSQIDSQKEQLAEQLERIRAAKSSLDRLLAADQKEAYNAQVDNYNAQVSDYNASAAALRTQIADYNSLVAERNSVAEQLNILSKAVDTRIQEPQAAP